MNKNNNCNNCGKQGHQCYQCKLPIISYGVVAFRPSERGLEYLMIRRKNSFGYIDFIRGKYIPTNLEHLQAMFDEMSVVERENILHYNFETLWRDMWGGSGSYKHEEMASQKKFESLKHGLPLGPNGDLVTLCTLIQNATTYWIDTEWEFPKGRRNYQEKDIDCALREFEEETGIVKTQLKIVENVLPFEEMFLGSNHKSYKHKYYLGLFDDATGGSNNLTMFQRSEVSKLEWKTIDECLESIRDYSLEKKQLITNINKVLTEYRLY